MHQIKTLAFILKSTPCGEADRRIVFFTKKLGKITAFAKGVRKTTSRKGGNLELFNLVQLELKEKNNFFFIEQVQMKEYFLKLKENLISFNTACLVAEMTLAITPEQSYSPKIFNLLLDFFSILKKSPDASVKNILYAFCLKLLFCLGYLPDLSLCRQCGKKLYQGENFYNFQKTELLCPACTTENASPLALNDLKILNFFSRKNFAQIIKLKTENFKIASFSLDTPRNAIHNQDLRQAKDCLIFPEIIFTMWKNILPRKLKTEKFFLN